MKDLHNTFLDLETIIVSQFPNLLQAIQSTLEQDIAKSPADDQAKKGTDADEDIDSRWQVE